MEKRNLGKTKFIFVTGGVLSGLGKGVSAASLGRLLKARGFKIFVQKFDPYYNVDPGTMSPYQHGEVFVTHDGGETDLDLGHYERFIGEKFTKQSNYVQGAILKELLDEERAGKFNGSTVQVVPHVTNKIIDKIEKAAISSKADFVITEIGGTVGDIESQPFIYAISQFSRIHRDSSFFIHATYIPFLAASSEFKSKPTQNSVSTIQSMGIFPNMLLLRANEELPGEIVSKIASKTLIEQSHCIPVPNADNIYKVPQYFEAHKMAQKVLNHFGMEPREADLADWDKYVSFIDKPKQHKVTIAMIGKYVEFKDAYMSIIESLKISGNLNSADIAFKWIQSENLNEDNVASKINGSDGVVILPGFGKRGFDGKVKAAQYLEEHDIPTLGICYGFQAMTVSHAIKNGIKDATSSEVSETGTFVIDIIKGKEKGTSGGTLRLGESETIMSKGSVVEGLYGSTSAFERHRHRFETNPVFASKVEDDEFIFSGKDKTTGLLEVCEMPKKKFYVGLQAHPEFNTNPLKEHPLFKGFINASIENKKDK
ncbi:MAG: CTP synthase [Mycoplasmataceae bacterium]|nr:CTP synthase [Mycoplasmataceae bacterium]